MQMDKLDILKRDTFVEKVLHLLDNISCNKSSVCFAINGQCPIVFQLSPF